MATGLLVERLRSQVDPIRPDNSCCLWIDANLCKEGRIAERLEDTAPLPRGEVDIAYDAVIKEQAKTVWSDHCDAYDSW